ncbi:MAG: hypothetical protein HKP40_07230 [Litoreibacter sp.]|nr:hypothetical protein [Litoreibacter sp.]
MFTGWRIIPEVAQRIALGLVVLGLTILGAAPTRAQVEGEWSLAVFGAVMTDNVWEDTMLPWELEFIDAQMVGVVLAYQIPMSNPRWQWGFELQAMAHLGKQDHLEFNIPLVLRYEPRRPWIKTIDSYGFGIGWSHATQIPETEIARHGASRRGLIYWMAEVEFETRRPDRTVFLRLHHRSDAFGLLEPEAGSNAIGLGIRHAF